MKYLKSYSLFENTTILTQEQIDWLNKCTQGTWELNRDTGLVDVKGGFYCYSLKDFKGVRFGVVTEDFYCSYNQLTSLEGAPQVVGWDFDCSNNKLTTLVGAPKEVGGHFRCYNNKLTSLEGAPQVVGGDFSCSNNKLTSLVGAPQKVKDFNCSRNNLTSLEGAPQVIGGDFSCFGNPVSKKALNIIFDKMKSVASYPVALASSKNEIPKRDWDLLDKTGLSPDLEKGASTLGRFGVFDS